MDEDGILSGNVYVNNGLGANSGITHKQEAEGLSYEELLQRDGIPSEFYRIQVKFLVDGSVIKELDCEYGNAVQNSEIPDLPEKDGFYGEWETEKLENVLVDQSIHVIYYPYVTAIASSDDKKPVMMAEGAFYPGAELVVREETNSEENAEANVPDGYKIARTVSYQVSFGKEHDSEQGETVRARIYAGSHANRMLVGVKNGEQLQIVPSENSGEYLIFETEPQGTLMLLDKKGVSGLIAAAVICFLAAAGGGSFYMIRKKTKQDAKKTEGEEESNENGEPNENDMSEM